jgi:hypothetical protein
VKDATPHAQPFQAAGIICSDSYPNLDAGTVLVRISLTNEHFAYNDSATSFAQSPLTRRDQGTSVVWGTSNAGKAYALVAPLAMLTDNVTIFDAQVMVVEQDEDMVPTPVAVKCQSM